jgi:hypothetical protein
MNKTMPDTCSVVHTFLNKKKERNKVIAFRAVDVMDMVRAPNCLVMAAEQEDPKNPMLLNNTRTVSLPATDQVHSSIGVLFWYSSNVPGCANQTRPSRKSPLTLAAAVMAMRAIEYMRKMN